MCTNKDTNAILAYPKRTNCEQTSISQEQGSSVEGHFFHHTMQVEVDTNFFKNSFTIFYLFKESSFTI